MAKNIIPITVIEEDIDLVIDNIVIDKDFEKWDREIEICRSMQQLNYTQEYEDRGIKILDDLNERWVSHPLIQAKVKRSRHNDLSHFIISQE